MVNKKGILAVVFSLSLLLSGIPVSAGEEKGAIEEAAEITIYHTNDTHGYLEGDGKSVIGLPIVAGLKKADENAILVDAGDATQGLPLASLTKGNDVMRLMNLAGYDLMIPGNHEFDFGADTFLQNVSLAQFPVLAANIYRNGNLLLKGMQENTNGCHIIIERKGKKIGFFGLTTTETASAANPEGIKGIEFADEIETAKTEITHLEEEGADVVIAVTHMGDETGQAPCTSEDLANSMTGDYQGKLDAIIDGHSHTVENKEVNDVRIVQTGSGLVSVGKMTVTIEEGTEPEVTEQLLGISDLSDVQGDQKVQEELDRITEEQSNILKQKIGEAPTSLWAGDIGNIRLARLVETNYGDLAADAFAYAAKQMVQQSGTEEEKQMPITAVENGGGIREKVANGMITKENLVSAFPFSNTIYMKKVTPKILYEMMEQSGSTLDGQNPATGMLLQKSVSGGFLQISGFCTVFNPDAEPGNRVVSITLDGMTDPLDRNDDTTQILLASNNYIMSGGNDYTMLSDLPKYAEAGGELETIESFIEQSLENGVLNGYQGTKRRISYSGSQYQPKDYTASIKIVDKGGNLYRNQKITFRIDGGEGKEGMTDEKGILHITVSDGGHGIRVSDYQAEVYVDNYAGIGLIEDEMRSIPELTAPEAGQEIPTTGQEETEDSKEPVDTDQPVGENSSTNLEETAVTAVSKNNVPKDNGSVSQEQKAPSTGDTASVEKLVVMLILSGTVIVMSFRGKCR